MSSNSMLFAIALDFTVTISHSRSAFDNFQLKTFAQDELIPFIIYLSVVLAFRQDVINSAYELLEQISNWLNSNWRNIHSR